MPFQILLNSSNVINSYNTVFDYKFISGAFEVNEGAEICVSSITLPYSWFNVNKALYNNNGFSYTWADGTTYSVTLPDGFYTVTDLNQYLQNVMISNNQYLINTSTGQYQYFISLFTNVTYYTNSFILTYVPTSLPSGYNAPTGFVYSTTTAKAPQLIIPSNNFGKLIGYSAGSYPSTQASGTAMSYLNVLGNITPNITPVNAITVRCNLCNNECASPTDVLDVFNINTTFGSNIVYTPNYEKWISANPGTYANIFVYLQDQNLNTIISNDSNVSIAILLRNGKKSQTQSLGKQRATEVEKAISDLVEKPKLEFKDEKGMYLNSAF